MEQYGLSKVSVTTKTGLHIEAEKPAKMRNAAMVPVALTGKTLEEPDPYDGEFGGTEMEGVDNSATMAEYGSDYDDPDLYPSGVDPIAEIRERMRNHG
jgi:hypothetical protein